MTAVGPSLAQTIPQTPAPAGGRASQAAFFRAALSGAAPVPPVAPVAATAPMARSMPGDETTGRPTRPGALLDIRV